MENSLVRSPLARCPSFGGRKDVSHIQSRSGHLQRQYHPIRCRRKPGHPTYCHRDSNQFIYDSIDEAVSSKSTKHCTTSFGNSADGYVYASSQLRLSPCSWGAYIGSMDEIPNWNQVSEVSVFSETTILCPICLSCPISPRMERCAHVYCGPCAVQYIRYENERASKKCAVCSWVMRLQDLKRVHIISVDSLKVGNDLNMTLVWRPKSCASETFGNNNPQPLSSGDPRAFHFVTEVSWNELYTAHTHDKLSLSALRNECLSSGETELLPHITYLMSQISDEMKEFENSSNLAPSPEISCHTARDVCGTDDAHHFYQASDGRLIFLDGLMWKCLLSEFGSIAAFPPSLNVSITALRTQKMTLASSKRWRHLNHIPIGHWFTFVEIDLKPLVSNRVLEKFASSLRARSIERSRRYLEDLQLTQLKEAAENQLPLLPPGFVLSGHAELSDDPINRFHPSDFVPLCNSADDEHKTKFSSSFAEVTKSGARSFVDRNRVANFSRGSASHSTAECFDPSTEAWPSLSASTKPVIVEARDNQSLASSQATSMQVARTKRRRKKNSQITCH